MSEKFTVEVISPDRTVLKVNATEVVVPSYEGEIGILKDHIPLITFLRPGLIKIIDETNKILFVEDGTVEFVNNNLLILTSTSQEIANFDKASINQLLNQAEKKISDDKITDKEKYLLSYKIETLKNINK